MSAAADTDGSGFKSQGAHHQTQNGIAQKSQVPAQHPPPQRHGANRGFIEPLSESASRFPVG